MLIIDIFPIILTALFTVIGIQSARVHESSKQLSLQIDGQKKQLQNEQYFHEALINNTPDAVIRLDHNHRIITCNQAFEKLFGYSKEEIIGKYLDDMITSEGFLEEASRISASVSEGNLERLISKRKKKDGTLIDVEIFGIPVSAGGQRIGVMGHYHDLSEQIQAEQELVRNEARFKSLFNESPVSLWEEDFSEIKNLLEEIGSPEEIIKQLDEDDDLVYQCLKTVRIIDVNQATLNLLHARDKEELMGGLTGVVVEESLAEFRNEIKALVNGEHTFECEIYQKKVDGGFINGWLRLTLPPGYESTWERVYISIVDITQRKNIEDRMRYLSFHDSLTGAYNRAYFDEELSKLQNSRRYPISIIVCDLDGLKKINDKHGHAVGDQAIKAAAYILGSATFRKEDVVARTGGDEFAIILPAVDLDQHGEILERLNNRIKNFNNSCVSDGLYRPISMSFGYAVVHEGESLEAGLKNADHVMYEKKKMGYWDND